MKLNAYKIRQTVAGIIFVLTLIAIYGGAFRVKLANIAFLPLLQRLICDFSLAALLLFLIIIVTALLFGRIYCSAVCPLGIFREFFAFFRVNKKSGFQKKFSVKYLIAGLSLGALAGGTALLIRYIDPYSVFASAFSPALAGAIILAAVLISDCFTKRFFCTNICPAGAVLGLISKLSLNKIHIDEEKCVSCGKCENACPAGCIDIKNKCVDNETCLKCLKCLNICPERAILFGVRREKFSLKRRAVLRGIGAFAVIGAGYAAGLQFAKRFSQKIKSVILPPGAVDSERIAKKCLNCNLCINNCPNGILSKADGDFPFVHIDYEKKNGGKGFCDYNCKRCGDVCPSGAIKKMTLEQKRTIKIASAVVTEDCIGCGNCYRVCPAGAIKRESGGKISIDDSKCIGCGKCAVNCPTSAIKISDLPVQQII